MKKAVSAILLVMLLADLLYSAFNIQPVRAVGVIYIRADGSIDPPTASISTLDGITYTFSCDINDYSIIVEEDDIIIDGAGFSLVGSYEFGSIGLDLTGRSNITIENVNIRNFWRGIRPIASSEIRLLNNNLTANAYCVIAESSSNIIISGNNITDNGNEGVRLHHCSSSNVTDNNIANNKGYGIILYKSTTINILMNNMTGNTQGIEVLVSTNVNFFSNYITESGIAIRLLSPSNINFFVNISGNSIIDNQVGIDLESASNVSVSRNNVVENACGISLYSSDANLSANNITENTCAIALYRSFGAGIINNNLEDNRNCGICLYDSLNNMICGNNIARNIYGVSIRNSFNNSIYNNNFIDNAQHVSSDATLNFFDNGYPSGGNFWSGYVDVDLSNGPYQNITGGDGIWDHPYIIDAGSTDRFPLRKCFPWDAQDVAIVNMTSEAVVKRGFLLQINMTLFNYGNDTETFNITIYANITLIGSLTGITLVSRNSKVVTFVLNTARFADHYAISAYAWPVLGEIDTTDNVREVWVFVATSCDINGDGIIDILDIAALASAFGSRPEGSNWNPLADINNDGTVDILDIVIVVLNFGGKS